MGCVMTLVLKSPAFVPRERSATLERKISFALSTYGRSHRQAVTQVAARHPALADLALSFPALLFVAAVPHKGIDRDRLQKAVIEGQSLRDLARLAGLPLWTRKLKPQAFEKPLLNIPDGEWFARQIPNFIPKRARKQAKWLECVAFSNRWGTPAFALWVAQHDNQLPKYGTLNWLFYIGLWCWFCENKETDFGRLVSKGFHPRQDLKQVARLANDWIANVNLHLYVQITPSQSKFVSRIVNEFEFVNLSSTSMIVEEAEAMHNCLKGYGHDISFWSVELWSVRKEGRRVATLSLANSYIDSLPMISEIKACNNEEVSREVALAARKWFAMHDLEHIQFEDREVRDEARRMGWIKGFKPYWIAKKAFPTQLRLNGALQLCGI
jgi:hypothetical protein